jgi:hypothetical protein
MITKATTNTKKTLGFAFIILGFVSFVSVVADSVDVDSC